MQVSWHERKETGKGHTTNWKSSICSTNDIYSPNRNTLSYLESHSSDLIAFHEMGSRRCSKRTREICGAHDKQSIIFLRRSCINESTKSTPTNCYARYESMGRVWFCYCFICHQSQLQKVERHGTWTIFINNIYDEILLLNPSHCWTDWCSIASFIFRLLSAYKYNNNLNRCRSSLIDFWSSRAHTRTHICHEIQWKRPQMSYSW